MPATARLMGEQQMGNTFGSDAGLQAEPLLVRPLMRSDWGWVQAWFQDPVLDRELGPLDAEWLTGVLTQSHGVQLVLSESSERPVALVGCVWGGAGLAHAITDIAVDPACRSRGIGRRAVEAALSWSGHPPAERWIAFVDPDNEPAFHFFTALGWKHEGRDDLMERFALGCADSFRPV